MVERRLPPYSDGLIGGNIYSTEDLVHLTAKRSVFSAAELDHFNASADDPMKVIDFL
jgi:hypothetical protein